MRTHYEIDQRSIALHTAIAQKLEENPLLLDIAKKNLDRWCSTDNRAKPYFDRWREILGKPLEEITSILSQDSEAMRGLRQNSPFAGILTPKERWKIYEAF